MSLYSTYTQLSASTAYFHVYSTRLISRPASSPSRATACAPPYHQVLLEIDDRFTAEALSTVDVRVYHRAR
jgi:hypothetical protein